MYQQIIQSLEKKKEPSLDAVQHDQLAAGDHEPCPGIVWAECVLQHPLYTGQLLRHTPGKLT